MPAHAAHWSDAITWRPGRWDPMSNAPRDQRIRVRTADGRIVDGVRFTRAAWRQHRGGPLAAEEWQPLRAEPDEPPEPYWPFPISIPPRPEQLAADPHLLRGLAGGAGEA